MTTSKVQAVDFAEPLVGWAEVQKDGNVYHAGMGANQIIFNPTPDANLGFASTRGGSPATQTIERCINSVSSSPFNIATDIVRCFYMSNSAYGDNLLTSRTARDGSVELETAALIYVTAISGDVYGLQGSGANFSLYGRNSKTRTTDVNNETWNAGDTYSFNPNAQASFSGMQLDYVAGRIKQMAGEAQTVTWNTLNNASTWYLQGTTITDRTQGDRAKYPEGKVWLVTGCPTVGDQSCLPLIANKVYPYAGIGTIIILQENGGYMTMTGGSKISAVSRDDALGIIIAGKDSEGNIVSSGMNGVLDFKGKNLLEAAVLTLGTIRQSGTGNIEGIGSFAADNFSFMANTGIIFKYDNRFESKWPPGFRYFNMPAANNTAP